MNQAIGKIELCNTPQELHSRAIRLIDDLHQYTFGNLPAILERVISERIWLKLPAKFKNFGEYALAQSVDGLCIDSNEKLWLLRSVMDCNQKHVVEWQSVLLAVEKCVKAIPIEERGKIGNSISLNKLAQSPDLKKKITYYPSRAPGQDRDVLMLGKKAGNYLAKISSGQLTRKQALIRAGLLKERKALYNKTKSSFNLLGQEQKLKFINWLKAEKYI